MCLCDTYIGLQTYFINHVWRKLWQSTRLVIDKGLLLYNNYNNIYLKSLTLNHGFLRLRQRSLTQIFDTNPWQDLQKYYLPTIFDTYFWQLSLVEIFDNYLWYRSLTTIFDNYLWQLSLTTIFDNYLWQLSLTDLSHWSFTHLIWQRSWQRSLTQIFDSDLWHRPSIQSFDTDLWQRSLTQIFEREL